MSCRGRLSDSFVLFVPFVVKKTNANNRLHLTGNSAALRSRR